MPDVETSWGKPVLRMKSFGLATSDRLMIGWSGVRIQELLKLRPLEVGFGQHPTPLAACEKPLIDYPRHVSDGLLLRVLWVRCMLRWVVRWVLRWVVAT